MEGVFAQNPKNIDHSLMQAQRHIMQTSEAASRYALRLSSEVTGSERHRRYYLKDHLGSTRAVVDNQGNLLETHDYWVFPLMNDDKTFSSPNIPPCCHREDQRDAAISRSGQGRYSLIFPGKTHK